MIRRPPSSPPFPYTPLSRSRVLDATGAVVGPDAPLDLPLAFRWFEAAGADPDSALVDWQAREALQQIAARLRMPLHVPSDRKSTRLNSSHANISYAVFCLKK